MTSSGKPMRNRAALLLASTALAGLTAAPAAAAPDDALPVLSYVKYEDAFNRGQPDAALEQFADDATVIAGPACNAQKPCAGKAAIREGLLARFIAVNIAVTIREVNFDGQRLRSKVEVSTDVMRQRGFTRIVGNDTIEFRGGKIASLVFKPDTADEETARWVQANQPPAAAAAAAQR